MDDIIVYGNTFGAHLRNLAAVFARLRQAGLKLQSQKCFLLQKEVNYLGHIVSEQGVRPDHSKQRRWLPGLFLSQLRRYNSFLVLLVTIEDLLSILLLSLGLFTVSQRRTWTKECQESFEKLRCLLTTPPTLAFPNFDHPLFLTQMLVILVWGQCCLRTSMAMRDILRILVELYQSLSAITVLHGKSY